MTKGVSRVTRECKPPMGPSLTYMAEITLSIPEIHLRLLSLLGFLGHAVLDLDFSNKTDAAQL